MTQSNFIAQLRLAKEQGSTIIIHHDQVEQLLAELTVALGISTLADRTRDHVALKPVKLRMAQYAHAMSDSKGPLPALREGEVWARFKREREFGSDMYMDPWFVVKPGDFSEKDREELEIGTPCLWDMFVVDDDMYVRCL
jgi:hypothetical protein